MASMVGGFSGGGGWGRSRGIESCGATAAAETEP
jgi:hypothetical protein